MSEIFPANLPEGVERQIGSSRYQRDSKSPVAFNLIVDYYQDFAKVCFIGLHSEVGGDAVSRQICDLARHFVFSSAKSATKYRPEAIQFYIYDPKTDDFSRALIKWRGRFVWPSVLRGRFSGSYDLEKVVKIDAVPNVVKAGSAASAFTPFPDSWRILPRGSLVTYSQPWSPQPLVGCVMDHDDDLVFVFWGRVYDEQPIGNYVRSAEVRPFEGSIETRQMDFTGGRSPQDYKPASTFATPEHQLYAPANPDRDPIKALELYLNSMREIDARQPEFYYDLFGRSEFGYKKYLEARRHYGLPELRDLPPTHHGKGAS